MSRAFGIGATHSYNIFLVGDTSAYSYFDLILSDGGRIHYTRSSPGTGFGDAIFEHTGTQTSFYKSQVTWNGFNGWNLKFKDGTLWTFPYGNGRPPALGAITSITDRNGNALIFTRDSAGNLIKIASPSNRWISFSYDPAGRITQAQDNSGRMLSYSYDVEGRLIKV